MVNMSLTPFTKAEAAAAIKRLKCRKMPGPDDIPAEVAKVFPGAFSEAVIQKANTALPTSIWPDEWTAARRHAIPKAKAQSNPSTFRLVAALSTEAKIAT